MRQQIIEVSEANPRSSAVGSAPRSGRGGRAFESPLLDKKTVRRLSFLLGIVFQFLTDDCLDEVVQVYKT